MRTRLRTFQDRLFFAVKRRLAQVSLLAFGRDTPVRFIVLTRSRTGSNHLSAMLNSHPNVLAQPEIFSVLNGRSAEDVLARWRAPKAFFIKASGFKIFYYHPHDTDGTGLWATLAAEKSLKVIHLKRRNRLETELSQKLATVTGQWLQTAGEASRPVPRITLEPKDLEEAFEKTSDYEAEFERKFQGHPVCEIYYEDMLTDFRSRFENICDFLEVPRREGHSNLVKQGREPASQVIENFASLKAYFRNTRWAKFFDPHQLTCFLYVCVCLEPYVSDLRDLTYGFFAIATEG